MAEEYPSTMCMVCLEKTTKCKKEDGEIVMCESCKLVNVVNEEGKLMMKRDLDKDGKNIGHVKDNVLELPENMDLAEYLFTPPPGRESSNMMDNIKTNDNSLLHKRRQKQEDQGLSPCAICGSIDVAHKNYGVDCCLSCKAFFWRQVLIEKPLICINGENDCEITEITRTNCKSCRYKRCLTLGMDPSLIQQRSKKSKEDFAARYSTMVENRSLDSLSPCAICGSVEVAHKNYGVDCCKSCKIFFLRNVSRDTQLVCVSRPNSCVITKANRTNCKRCRYERCLAAGFTPEYKNYQKNRTPRKEKQKASKASHKQSDTSAETTLDWDVEKDSNNIQSKDLSTSKDNLVFLAKREPDNVHWVAKAEDAVQNMVVPELRHEPSAPCVVKSEPSDNDPVKCEPSDHDPVKCEPSDHDPVKCEPDVDRLLECDPLYENVCGTLDKHTLKMEGLVIKSVETDTGKKPIFLNQAKSEVQVEEMEKDPLDVSQPTCHICHAAAPGILCYGGICCYSCRAFFRRAGSSDFICLIGDNRCIVNQKNRTKCKRCRYQRCLDAGMKPYLVDRTLPGGYMHRGRSTPINNA